ncbi:gliding motility-associated C-terminal domain-containing protein [Spirosoma soli]|uniref:Gliding motility-associated C-terminal domain-containing protein n=1 Tax=Spirosoma soli TaxID=1770529 RepID=A0ABW5MB65_9BACT
MFGKTVHIAFWLLACLPGTAIGQELIPNGSFETYANCPRQDNLLSEATPWYNPNQATPDFYNQCFPTSQIEIPPRTGQGLARLFLDQGWAEYLATPLVKPLEAGECYYFEMYVSTKTPNQYVPQTLGAYFSDNPVARTDKGLLGVSPQVLDSQAKTINSPSQWEKIAGYLKATGNERYLTIGSFVQLPRMLGFYYIFLDDISLLPIRLDLGKDTTLCGRKSTYTLNGKTPGAIEYRWQDGSRLSTFPVTRPGKYWVTVTTPCKILSDTITVDYTLDFDLGPDTTLCNEQTIVLKAPTSISAYEWQDGSSQNVYQVKQSGQYSLRATQGNCTVRDTIQIRYIRPPQLELGPSKELCGAEVYTINPTFAEGTFRWLDEFSDIERVVKSSGVFRASVRNDCATVIDSVEVGYGTCGCVIYAPNSFTPNADGVNDAFVPFACGDIAIKSLAIFNRWGEVIFQTDDAPFQWDGRYQNELCPNGVYAWRINYELRQRGQISQKQQQGAITLAY